MVADAVGQSRCSPSDRDSTRSAFHFGSLLGKIQMGENPCSKKLGHYSVSHKSYLDSLFPIGTTWKIIHLALNYCCTYIPGPNPPLLLSLNYLSLCLSLATILSVSALARAVSLIIPPWIRHYWAMPTQETAGNSQLASLSIIEQSCSYRLDKLIHLKVMRPWVAG